MRFEWPYVLLALVLVPIAGLGYRSIEHRRVRYAVRYTNIEVLERVTGSAARWRSSLPVAFALLGLTCALVAIARPERDVAVANDQTSIVLAVDTSASMAADDVRPTRLAAADAAIRSFIATIPKKYRIALVAFSAETYVAAPLTWDHDLILQALADLSPGQGTAIGDALARSVGLLEPILTSTDAAASAAATAASLVDDVAPSAILLLSDGAQTSGRLSPLVAAARARDDGIPVDTIALGTPKGAIQEGVISLPVPPDRALLRRIAQTTGGQFFAPTDGTRLDAVYEHLATRLGRTHRRQELAFVLEGLAALFVLTAGALAMVWSARLP